MILSESDLLDQSCSVWLSHGKTILQRASGGSEEPVSTRLCSSRRSESRSGTLFHYKTTRAKRARQAGTSRENNHTLQRVNVHELHVQPEEIMNYENVSDAFTVTLVVNSLDLKTTFRTNK